MNKIINFHDITDGILFERVIAILMSKYKLVSIVDIGNFYYKNIDLRNSCHLTFDDGDKTFYEIAYPILKKHNIPASIFVSPHVCKEKVNYWFQEIEEYDIVELKKIICENYPYEFSDFKKYSIFSILKCFKIAQIWNIIELYQKKFDVTPKEFLNIDVDHLKQIDSEGLVTIGAHTMNHPILANEDDQTSQEEITKSFLGLEEILGHEINYFAFPNGIPKYDFGAREVETLKSINCKIAFSCPHKNITKYDNPLVISRYNLSLDNLSYIKLKLFLGEYWDMMKNLLFKGEIHARIELKNKLNRSGVLQHL
jgi:peptidoglycan/xylan/chitin deacetylase (PgdA/CDA1 family)